MSRWLGILCEEFPCYGPKEAYEAWRALPEGLMEDIIEARSYDRAKSRMEQASGDKKTLEAACRSSALVALARQIDIEIVDADRRAKHVR